ncbi:MAG: hypothetical protein ACREOQ_11860 [Gemmatimonadales bacterium]
MIRLPATATTMVNGLRPEGSRSRWPTRGGEALRLSFSAGVAGTSEDVESITPEALLTRADTRLLAAKRAGRGRCIGAAMAEAPGQSS